MMFLYLLWMWILEWCFKIGYSHFQSFPLNHPKWCFHLTIHNPCRWRSAFNKPRISVRWSDDFCRTHSAKQAWGEDEEEELRRLYQEFTNKAEQDGSGGGTGDHISAVAVRVYVRKSGGHWTDPCCVTIDWSFTHPRSFNSLVALYLKQSTVCFLMGSFDCLLVSRNIYPDDKIVIQPRPHSHLGYVRLFLFHGGTNCKVGVFSFLNLKRCPLKGMALLIVLSSILEHTRLQKLSSFF